MVRHLHKPNNGQRTTDNGPRRGFTLVELLVVIIVLGILIALLLPVINGALRTSRNAAVQAEISLLAQALEQFKSKYGAYPPSRFLALENGQYSQRFGDTTTLHGGTFTDPTSPGTGDITLGQLAQRSAAALRQFFPQVNTSGPPTGNPNGWYDFNGNGVLDGAYVLHGHECLVFFLGGVPLYDTISGKFGLTGFGKDPRNPFTNSITTSAMYSGNRQPPLFEFDPGRLYGDPANTSFPANGVMPGYYDSLGNPAPGQGTTLNFYAYFSAYGSSSYDPNDVNLVIPNLAAAVYEVDANGLGPIALQYQASFPVIHSGNLNLAISPSPNPYTSTLTVTTSGTVTYQKPQTYQIISPGVDGLYGVGGQFLTTSSASTATVPLPFDPNNTVDIGSSSNTADSDRTVRQRELDNLTNFKSGTLQQ